MENIRIIKATKSTPLIEIDYDRNHIKMTGKLIVLNNFLYFEKIYDILNEFDWFDISLDISYFNTFSFKVILQMLKSDKIRTINWIYDPIDEDMIFKGDTISNFFKQKDIPSKIKFIKNAQKNE